MVEFIDKRASILNMSINIMNNNYAPIVVFAFNRPNVLKSTLEALSCNPLAEESDLYIYVDGPRHKMDIIKIAEVKHIVDAISGFKNIYRRYSKKNKGLADSIISGVSEVISQYGKVIVVEDDLFVSPCFITYMNQMLSLYKDDRRIMQVSGFGTKLKQPYDYPWDVYLNERAHSWTWGTWIDRWETIDWEVKDFVQLQANKRMQRDFCKRGSDLYGMLKGYMMGKNNSWYIRFNYSMYKQHRYAVCPIRSLVRNDGFTSEATHCNTYNRYKIDFEETYRCGFSAPKYLEPNEKIMRDAVKYWSLWYRIYGKLRTCFMKLTNI